jgi:hypothetical protein
MRPPDPSELARPQRHVRGQPGEVHVAEQREPDVDRDDADGDRLDRLECGGRDEGDPQHRHRALRQPPRGRADPPELGALGAEGAQGRQTAQAIEEVAGQVTELLAVAAGDGRGAHPDDAQVHRRKRPAKHQEHPDRPAERKRRQQQHQRHESRCHARGLVALGEVACARAAARRKLADPRGWPAFFGDGVRQAHWGLSGHPTGAVGPARVVLPSQAFKSSSGSATSASARSRCLPASSAYAAHDQWRYSNGNRNREVVQR